MPSVWSWYQSVVASWLFGYLYVLETNAFPQLGLPVVQVVTPGVYHASGLPSYAEGTSPPCRCVTSGIGPVYALPPQAVCPHPSGSAQCSVWSMGRKGSSNDLDPGLGRLFKNVTWNGVPRFASMVGPGYDPLYPQTSVFPPYGPALKFDGSTCCVNSVAVIVCAFVPSTIAGAGSGSRYFVSVLGSSCVWPAARAGCAGATRSVATIAVVQNLVALISIPLPSLSCRSAGTDPRRRTRSRASLKRRRSE